MSFFSFSRSIYRSIPAPQRLKRLLRDVYLRAFFPERLIEIRRELNLPYRGDPLSPELREQARLAYRQKAEADLDEFLATDETLQFPHQEDPELSVVIVVFNEPGLSYQCLKSLSGQHEKNIEVLIVDNASNQRTVQLLSRIDGANVVHNKNNVHYIAAVNSTLPHLRGRFTLLLNNDVILEPETVSRMLKTVSEDSTIGAASPQITSIDNLLLECGCEIAPDGHGRPLRRGEEPIAADTDPGLVEVDYVSGCFLLTPTAMLNKLGGLDTRYLPAYYDDSDYCTSLWSEGKRVVVDLAAKATHFESAASNADQIATLMERNRRRFVEKFNWQQAHQARMGDSES